MGGGGGENSTQADDPVILEFQDNKNLVVMVNVPMGLSRELLGV